MSDKKHITEYYQQLVGFEITRFELDEEHNGLESFPVFLLKRKCEKGGKDICLTIAVSRDAEGNGGGFLFIEPSNR
tara:strand:- start:1498 stop:1725 length:228 start_codon:yes stop_codon:yes gene_type:complete